MYAFNDIKMSINGTYMFSLYLQGPGILHVSRFNMYVAFFLIVSKS